MLQITFRYKDKYSKGRWLTQVCVMSSVQECIQWYGLGIDCEYKIIKVEPL